MATSRKKHFQGDPLYSDSIVKPENNFTETEAFECYPVPEKVPQNGLSEGFYPDSTIAYIRVLWKEFEPEDGQYNYAFIEDILAKAKAVNQKVMFRLLPHSTRESDDVPDWLKKIIPCPARPEGVREKASPTDPLYLKYLGRAIRKIGERFDDDPTLEYMDITLTGAWGEGSHREGFKDEDLFAVHIPQTGTKLDVESKNESYRQAAEFYKEAFGGGPVIFTCRSWLLFPRHREVMNPQSNMIAFMNDFDEVDRGLYDDYAQAWRLFGVQYEGDVDKLPQDNSLRRTYATWMKNGEKTGWAKGVIVYKV